MLADLLLNTKIGYNIKIMKDSKYIYKKELDKACFHHYIDFQDFKNLPRRSIAYKVLGDKVFHILKNPKYDGCQCKLFSMIYKELAKKLHKTIIKTFKKRQVHLSFKKVFGVLF